MNEYYKFQNPEGIYFITFSTIDWIDIFTRREYKDLIVESLNFCVEKKGLIIYAWVIMSNHLHLIVSSDNDNLSHTIRDFKRFTANSLIEVIDNNAKESRRKWIMGFLRLSGKISFNNKICQFWQHDNQPMEIDLGTNSIDNIVDYIHENPVKAGFVDSAEHYPYSSAIDYCDGVGRVKIRKI